MQATVEQINRYPDTLLFNGVLYRKNPFWVEPTIETGFVAPSDIVFVKYDNGKGELQKMTYTKGSNVHKPITYAEIIPCLDLNEFAQTYRVYRTIYEYPSVACLDIDGVKNCYKKVNVEQPYPHRYVTFITTDDRGEKVTGYFVYADKYLQALTWDDVERNKINLYADLHGIDELPEDIESEELYLGNGKKYKPIVFVDRNSIDFHEKDGHFLQYQPYCVGYEYKNVAFYNETDHTYVTDFFKYQQLIDLLMEKKINKKNERKVVKDKNNEILNYIPKPAVYNYIPKPAVQNEQENNDYKLNNNIDNYSFRRDDNQQVQNPVHNGQPNSEPENNNRIEVLNGNITNYSFSEDYAKKAQENTHYHDTLKNITNTKVKEKYTNSPELFNEAHNIPQPIVQSGYGLEYSQPSNNRNKNEHDNNTNNSVHIREDYTTQKYEKKENEQQNTMSQKHNNRNNNSLVPNISEDEYKSAMKNRDPNRAFTPELFEKEVIENRQLQSLKDRGTSQEIKS